MQRTAGHHALPNVSAATPPSVSRAVARTILPDAQLVRGPSGTVVWGRRACLGFEGYRRVQQYSRDVAQDLAREVGKLGPFELITRGTDLPVFAFKVRDEVTNFNVYDVSDALRERGWQVPAYTFPKNREDLAVLRVVVKRGFTHDVASLFVGDLHRQLPKLERQAAPAKDAESSSGFKH